VIARGGFIAHSFRLNFRGLLPNHLSFLASVSEACLLSLEVARMWARQFVSLISFPNRALCHPNQFACGGGMNLAIRPIAQQLRKFERIFLAALREVLRPLLFDDGEFRKQRGNGQISDCWSEW
jgi:hypothetical protein